MRYVTLLSVVLLAGCARQAEKPPASSKQAASPEPATSRQPITPGLGVMVGEVTSTSALVQVRICSTDQLVDGDVPGREGTVTFHLTYADGKPLPNPNLSEEDGKRIKDELKVDIVGGGVQWVRASKANDFIARTHFEGLQPGTSYRCTAKLASLNPQDHALLYRDSEIATAQFRTLPGAEASTPVSFVVVTGMNYAKFHGDDRIDRAQHLIENNTKLPKPYSGPDKHRGYPALESILKKKPDFFVGTGDNVYYDTPDKPRAKTVAELRRKWRQQFVQPRYRDLFAAVPTYWMIDDHDYRIDDCDNTGDYLPSPHTGRAMMLEQLPVAPANDAHAKTYRTHRVSRDLQIWFPENRMYRSPNAEPDGPEKTIWGTEQKEWLKRTLAESDATFRILISPTPMIGPDDLRKTDNHTNINGFRHERDEFFGWLIESKVAQNFSIICGDRHWQYHSISPEGIEEFSCGALVDANSRLGRKPGDPKSTDPEGLIKQPYYQTPRSGGFLQVKVTPEADGEPVKLTYEYNDEHGNVLHKHTKSAEPASR